MTTSKTLTASAPYIQTRHNLVHVHILSDLHVLTCIAVMYMHSQVQPYKTDQTSVYMPRMSARAHVIKFRKKVKKRKKLSKYTILLFLSVVFGKVQFYFCCFHYKLCGITSSQVETTTTTTTSQLKRNGIINLGSQCGERPCYRWTMSP